MSYEIVRVQKDVVELCQVPSQHLPGEAEDHGNSETIPKSGSTPRPTQMSVHVLIAYVVILLRVWIPMLDRTDCPYRVFLVFLRASVNCYDLTSDQTRPVPSTDIPVDYSLIIIKFDAIYFELLTGSLDIVNK